MYRYLIVIFVFVLTSLNCFSQKHTDIKNYVHDTFDVQPSFPGGHKNMFTFIGNNIKYPQKATENNIQGTVMIEMIVRKDGRLDSIVVVKDIGGGCGKEAVRVFKMMPKWEPAKLEGRIIATRIQVPVKFVLDKPKNTKVQPNKK